MMAEQVAASLRRLIPFLLLCLRCSHSNDFGLRQGVTEQLTDLHPRVAAVFHGSARSFLLPRVHASIKRNLLDALDARVDVFVRTTTQDNVHGPNMGAEGVFVNQSGSTVEFLQRALSHISPTQVVYFNLTDDHTHMLREFGDENDHEVFRSFDPRRYSMYFHRCLVYRMATAYAKEHGFEYDW